MPLQANQVNTPALFVQACEEIADGLLTVIKAQVVPPDVEAGEKVPKVINRLVTDADGNLWAARLRSPRHLIGDAEPKKQAIHSFMVGYGGIATRDANTVGRKGWTLRFVVNSYYEDDIGTDVDNAERRHQREVALVAFAIMQSGNLGCPGLVHRVTEFRERRGPSLMGEGIARQSLGEIYVELEPLPLRPPA